MYKTCLKHFHLKNYYSLVNLFKKIDQLPGYQLFNGSCITTQILCLPDSGSVGYTITTKSDLLDVAMLHFSQTSLIHSVLI